MRRLACCLVLALAGGCFQQTTVQPVVPPPMPVPQRPVSADQVNVSNAQWESQRLQAELDREEEGTGRLGQPGPR
jgi:hypothetical protein